MADIAATGIMAIIPVGITDIIVIMGDIIGMVITATVDHSWVRPSASSRVLLLVMPSPMAVDIMARRMCAGAMTIIALTGRPTTRSSPTTVRAVAAEGHTDHQSNMRTFIHHSAGVELRV